VIVIPSLLTKVKVGTAEIFHDHGEQEFVSLSANSQAIGPPTRDRGPLLPAFLALFLLGGQMYLILTRGFANVLETPFLPYCLLGTFAIHLATRPSRFEVLTTLVLGCLLALGFVFLRPDFRPTWPNDLAGASSFGLASLAALTASVVRLRGPEQREKLNTLIAGSVFIYTSLFIAFVLKLTATFHPQTYDLYLYAADAGFGIPIAAQAGVLLRRHPDLSWCCGLVYESLPLAVSLLYAYEKGGRQPLAIRVLPAFLGGGAAAYLLYNVLPAAGPVYIFGTQFPDHLPHLVQLAVQAPLKPDAPRNAVPSMHLACTLLIFWNARRLSRAAYLASALYLGLTILATLGFGEHYVVDLVAGVPYALLLGAACAPKSASSIPERTQALAAGLALTCAWILALRFAPFAFQMGGVAWVATGATLAICCAVQLRLERAWATRPLSSSPDPQPESRLQPDPASVCAGAGSHSVAVDTLPLP